MPERLDHLAKHADDVASASSAGGGRGAREAASDDLANFEAFFHQHYGALCEYIRHIVHLPHVAEELAQDAFVSLWERHTRAPVQMAISYLYTTARNRAYSYLRHRRVARSAAREMAADASEPRDETLTVEVHAHEPAEAVQRAIDELPERCRLIFLMSRREGLSYAEIAHALDVAVSTVETQISRALKHLRTRLGPYLVLSAALSPVLELARRCLS